MGNNVTVIPKKPARQSLLTSTENIVYMPLASKNSHGIVKVGDGLNITTDGLLSVDFSSKWYSDIKLDVDALKIDVEEVKTDLTEIGDDFTNIEERVSDVEEGRKIISIYQPKRDTGLVTVDKTVVGGINELKNQTQININDIRVNKTNIGDIKQNYATTKYVDNLYSKMSVGGNNSYVFETREQFISWLDGTFTREDLFKPELLKIGDVIFIEEMGVPDYWVKSKNSPMTINDFREYEAKIDIPEIKYDGISISKNELGELQAIAIKNGRLIITDDVNRSDFGGWVELSEAQYNELVEYGSITVGDKIIEYSEDDVYITPDTSYSVKQGTTPPTQDTVGEPGQFYLDVVTKKLYVCTATNEWLDVSSTDLTDYVKNTDYATNDKGGVVKVNETYGTRMVSGVLDIMPAQYSLIDSRQTNEYPLYIVTNYTRHMIVPANVDYAVKKSLVDCKLKGTTFDWTEEEKASAVELLGAVKRTTGSREIYGNDWQGNPATYRVDYPNDATVNGIPVRAANGAIQINDASCEDGGSGSIADGTQAVNKNYVKKLMGQVSKVLLFTNDASNVHTATLSASDIETNDIIEVQFMGSEVVTTRFKYGTLTTDFKTTSSFVDSSGRLITNTQYFTIRRNSDEGTITFTYTHYNHFVNENGTVTSTTDNAPSSSQWIRRIYKIVD